jgi:hypothetical protein
MSCTVEHPVGGLEALVSEPQLTIPATLEQIFHYDNSICIQYANNRMTIVFNFAIISYEMSRVSRSLSYGCRLIGELCEMICGRTLDQILADICARFGGTSGFSAHASFGAAIAGRRHAGRLMSRRYRGVSVRRGGVARTLGEGNGRGAVRSRPPTPRRRPPEPHETESAREARTGPAKF